jgi:hypothetical protein
MVPYGLRHQVRLDGAYTTPIPEIAYDPRRQLSTVGGRPLVEQPALMRQYTVTWGTTDRDNKTDDGG